VIVRLACEGGRQLLCKREFSGDEENEHKRAEQSRNTNDAIIWAGIPLWVRRIRYDRNVPGGLPDRREGVEL